MDIDGLSEAVQRAVSTGPLPDLVLVAELSNGAKVYSDLVVQSVSADGVVFRDGSRVDAAGEISGKVRGAIEVRGPGDALKRVSHSVVGHGAMGITIRGSVVDNREEQ